MSHERCLVMFAKYPEKGKVKSRLIFDGNQRLVADLYRCFIEDLLERLSAGNYRFWLAYDPPEKENDFIELFGNGFSYAPQRGADLGIRMHNIFSSCFFKGFQSVVIIGSDSPDLPKRIIEEAFDSLDRHDAVIGPTRDGGYYLIGFSRDSISERFFKDMTWSTDSVFQETMQRFHKDGVLVHVLLQWRDIDRPEDIDFLMNGCEKSDFGKSRTIQFLKEHHFTAGN